jgi:NTE family protein
MRVERNQTKGQSQLPGGRTRSIKSTMTSGSRRLSSAGNWALVLMGGGARGLAHIGVLRALLDIGLIPPIITGTSMGAVVGGLFSAGYLPGEIETIARELSSSQLARLKKRNFPVPEHLVDYFIFEAYQKKLVKRFGRQEADVAEDSLRQLVGQVKIEDLSIRFGCNAVDLVGGREVSFTSGPLYRALRASLAYPLLIDPARFDHSLLVDGGLLNNVPVTLARQLGAAKVLVPDVHRPLRKMSAAKLKSNLSVFFRLVQIVLADSTDSQLPRADLIININPPVNTFDFTQVKRVVNLGQRATQAKIKEIKKMISASR